MNPLLESLEESKEKGQPMHSAAPLCRQDWVSSGRRVDSGGQGHRTHLASTSADIGPGVPEALTACTL
ncbi:hypothetical protein GCM10022631_38500 [Deinococcus rubellus]